MSPARTSWPGSRSARRIRTPPRNDQQKARDAVRYIFIQDPKPLEQLRASLHNTVVELTAAPTLTESNKAVVAEVPAAAGAPAAPPTRGRAGRTRSSSRRSGPRWPGRRTRPASNAWPDGLGPLRANAACWTSASCRSSRARGASNRDWEEKSWSTRPGRPSRCGVDQRRRRAHRRRRRHPTQPAGATEDHGGGRPRVRLALAAVAGHAQAGPRRRRSARQDEAATAVPPVCSTFKAGETLVPAGQPLDGQADRTAQAGILEHNAFLARRSAATAMARAAAVFSMIFVLLVLCGVYMRYRQRGPLASLGRLTVILGWRSATVAAGAAGVRRSLAGGIGAAAAVRHDHGHRLSPGVGLAAVRRAGLDRHAGHRPQPARIPAAVRRDRPPPASTWGASAAAAS